MHVVYIHQYFTTPDQKGGTRSYEMARRLIQSGHRVTMVCGTTDLIDAGGTVGEVQRETIDGIDVVQIIQPYSNAMMHGKPVIAVDDQGISDVIDHGKTGWLVPGENQLAVTDALDPLLTDSALRSQIGKARQERVESSLTWQANAQQYLRIYRDAMG